MTEIKTAGYLQGYLPKTAAKKTYTLDEIGYFLSRMMSTDDYEAVVAGDKDQMELLRQYTEQREAEELKIRHRDKKQAIGKTAAEETTLTAEEINSEWEEFEKGDGALSGKARLDRIRELEVQNAERRASMAPDKRKAEDAKVIPRLNRLYAAGHAEYFMKNKTRPKYLFFGPKVTKKVWGVDILGQNMDPDYFMPDWKPRYRGTMIRTKGLDPMERYDQSVHDAPIGTIYY